MLCSTGDEKRKTKSVSESRKTGSSGYEWSFLEVTIDFLSPQKCKTKTHVASQLQ